MKKHTTEIYTQVVMLENLFDVIVNDIESTKVPFEVRSRKIDYEDHYPIMISDLLKLLQGYYLIHPQFLNHNN